MNIFKITFCFFLQLFFRFVIEENARKKKKKKKPRVIHALGNIKWGFTPPQKTGAINVDQLQNKWDREHVMKQQVQSTLSDKLKLTNYMLQETALFGSNQSLNEYRLLSKTIPWATVIR